MDSVFNYAHDKVYVSRIHIPDVITAPDIKTTGNGIHLFNATFTNDGKRFSLATGYGSTIKDAVMDLYRDYRNYMANREEE